MKKTFLSLALALFSVGVVSAQEVPQEPNLDAEPEIIQKEVKKKQSLESKKTKKEKVTYAPDGELGCKAAPLVSLTIVKGKPVKRISPKKIYVVEFWATWCGPCRAQFPHLSQLQKAYPHVTFMGVTSENDVAKITQFVKEQGDNMKYNVAIDATGAVSKKYSQAFKQNGIPHAFLVKEGKVIWVGHPATLEAQLKTHAPQPNKK